MTTPLIVGIAELLARGAVPSRSASTVIVDICFSIRRSQEQKEVIKGVLNSIDSAFKCRDGLLVFQLIPALFACAQSQGMPPLQSCGLLLLTNLAA